MFENYNLEEFVSKVSMECPVEFLVGEFGCEIKEVENLFGEQLRTKISKFAEKMTKKEQDSFVEFNCLNGDFSKYKELINKKEVSYKLNNEKKGVEIYFTSKPTEEVRSELKVNGFRWSSFNKCWYARQSEKAIQVAESLVGNVELEVVAVPEVKQVKQVKKAVKKEVITLSLWEATQFKELEGINKKQDAKTIAKELRSHIRKQFPQCKFSVTVPYFERIRFDIKSSPFEKDSVYLTAIKTYCENLMNAYKHTYCESNPYSDYAGIYNFTGWVTIDWDYKQTEVTEEIKKDMELFDSKLAEFEKAEELRKEQEWEEFKKQKEIKEIEYKKQIEVKEKQIENIYSNVEIKDLEESEQFMIVGAEFAHSNKNNTLDEYIEEVKSGEYSLENVKVIKEIHFNNGESLNNFSNMLLTDFDFLSGTGGSYTEDNRINSMIDFDNMHEVERKNVQWNHYGVAVYFDNKLQFVVDTQGYNYACYVGLTDNAKIKKELVTEQILSDDELSELKYQADQLEDISTQVITDLGIIETWKTTNWKLYKDTLKSKLKEYNFKLTNSIIQQLEIEELKSYMYKVLSEIDGIQEQFENANIQQGEKMTMFYISDWESMVTNRVVFDSVENTNYAQYDNAVRLTFKPEKKRKLHYNYFYSTMLVFKGWFELPINILHDVSESDGFKVSRTKYKSCDNRQYDAILEYFDSQGIKPIINTYKAEF